MQHRTCLHLLSHGPSEIWNIQLFLRIDHLQIFIWLFWFFLKMVNLEERIFTDSCGYLQFSFLESFLMNLEQLTRSRNWNSRVWIDNTPQFSWRNWHWANTFYGLLGIESQLRCSRGGRLASVGFIWYDLCHWNADHKLTGRRSRSSIGGRVRRSLMHLKWRHRADCHRTVHARLDPTSSFMISAYCHLAKRIEIY